MRPLLLLAAALVLGGACRLPAPEDPEQARNGPGGRPPPLRQPAPVRDTLLEQRAAQLELRLLGKEAEVEELQGRLDDARREVVRAMARAQSLATRAEAASGMAEAEIALQALANITGPSRAPEVSQAKQLLDLATAEFNKQNYGGALYLAAQAKTAAAVGQARLGAGERGVGREGEVPFAVPLRLQTTGRANVRAGPGSHFAVSYTLDGGTPVTAYAYADQWVRVSDESGRPGWIYQALIGRRPPG